MLKVGYYSGIASYSNMYACCQCLLEGNGGYLRGYSFRVWKAQEELNHTWYSKMLACEAAQSLLPVTRPFWENCLWFTRHKLLSVLADLCQPHAYPNKQKLCYWFSSPRVYFNVVLFLSMYFLQIYIAQIEE